MPDYTHKAIAARLAPAEPGVLHKAVMLHITNDLESRLTLLAKVMTQRSGKKITRNMLIIDAMEGFVAECTEQGLLLGMEVTADA